MSYRGASKRGSDGFSIGGDGAPDRARENAAEKRRVDRSRRDDSAASPSPQPKPVPAELPSGMSERSSKKGSWSPPVAMRALRGALAR
jgi:hypothetical protein